MSKSWIMSRQRSNTESTHALKALWAAPGHSLPIVAIIALATGANAEIFSAIVSDLRECAATPWHN